MTYEGNPARGRSRVMKVLVVITIALVAYWAVNGGLDEIEVADTSSAYSIVRLF